MSSPYWLCYPSIAILHFFVTDTKICVVINGMKQTEQKKKTMPIQDPLSPHTDYMVDCCSSRGWLTTERVTLGILDWMRAWYHAHVVSFPIYRIDGFHVSEFPIVMVLLLIEIRELGDCRKPGSFNYSTKLYLGKSRTWRHTWKSRSPSVGRKTERIRIW
jgi:hypothetical protein